MSAIGGSINHVGSQLAVNFVARAHDSTLLTVCYHVCLRG